MGKTSSEFTASAQKHANTTWFYLIVAGIVWYFFGWKWALIPVALGIYATFQSINATSVATRLKNSEQESESTDPEFVRIVQAYGNVLETLAPATGTVADASKLPYTKQEIKDAIIAALRISEDPQMKEHLKIGYIQLSDWQEGVGESNQGLDVSMLDMSQDTRALTQDVLEQTSGLENWTIIVQKEQELLKQELQELGLW